MSGVKKFDRKTVAAELCEWLSNGKTMASFCAQDGMPCVASIHAWMDEDENIARSIARARETGHDVIADDCLRIADEMPPCDERGKSDAGFVAWQKNRVWTRTQLLAKWNPKRYGDKVGVEHSGSMGLTINIDLSGD